MLCHYVLYAKRLCAFECITHLCNEDPINLATLAGKMKPLMRYHANEISPNYPRKMKDKGKEIHLAN